MYEKLVRASACALVVVLAACSSTAGPADDRMSYDDAVHQIGRPPNRTVNAPDGSVQATWETYSRNETRQLILTFDADRKLVESRNETVPRRR